MKVKVDKDLCIGCGACQALVAEVKVAEVNDNLKEDTADAIDNCPTQAISEE